MVNKILYGCSLYVGRKGSTNQLIVGTIAKDKNGNDKYGEVVVGENVSNSVSRLQPSSMVAHCRIDIDSNGTMTIVNTKEGNNTYVNNSDINKKLLFETDKVTLGLHKEPLNLTLALELAAKMVEQLQQATKEPPKVDTFNIRPLEAVWAEYEKRLLAINKAQHNINMLRSIPGIFTLASGFLIRLTNDSPPLFYTSIALMCISFVIFIYGIVKGMSFNAMEKQTDVRKWLQEHYVCPNPECPHFLGIKDFSIIRREEKGCAKCKCKYTYE